MPTFKYTYKGRPIQPAVLAREIERRKLLAKGGGQSMISRVFSGEREPRTPLLEALAEVLELESIVEAFAMVMACREQHKRVRIQQSKGGG